VHEPPDCPHGILGGGVVVGGVVVVDVPPLLPEVEVEVVGVVAFVVLELGLAEVVGCDAGGGAATGAVAAGA